jgi:energy-coupling factor transport system ATP-binding protein
VLILDEPTAGLDPAGRDEILFKIKDMHERMNMTVILVSHSMEDIAKLADRILVMNQGEVAMFDRTDAVFRRGEELTQMGLNVPQITRIADSLRKQGVPIREGIYTVEDALSELAPLLRQEGECLC